jgi:hypothetical protein
VLVEGEEEVGSETLPALLIRGEKTWRTCVPRLQAVTVSVDGATAGRRMPAGGSPVRSTS